MVISRMDDSKDGEMVNNIRNIGGGLANKVTNIDGNPIRGSLKKSGSLTPSSMSMNPNGSNVASSSMGANHRNPFDVLSSLDNDNGTREEVEVKCLKRFEEASLDEERFLQQKSKVDWLAAGDNNITFFHNSLKSINQQTRIDVFIDRGGVIHEGEDVQKAFVTHYENFLRCEGDTYLAPTPELFLARWISSGYYEFFKCFYSDVKTGSKYSKEHY
ncbi:hypothetical protein QVD17_41583 [Tagetes erecta]|uniref:Uncharacterized protein n=1 Tax=Tagetes erecta TaxID=13708 RepID=A0AAD8N8Z2_TARER|nr:hypothetical protein QVD17_41583 [Tagetes erecta]